ncbi:MAG: hypothetical protein WD355_01210 [Balneolaceae bacterium]
MNILTPEKAVQAIQSGDHIFIHTAAAAPQQLVTALTARYRELENVTLYHLHTEGAVPYMNPAYEKSFTTRVFFSAKNSRKAIEQGQANYIPVFLSEIPQLFHNRIIRLDVAMIQVSPPDRHGYCSLGVSVDATGASESIDRDCSSGSQGAA